MRQLLSKYAFFFPERTSVLLYHVATDGVLRLNAELARLVQDHADDLAAVREVHPDLYAALAARGFAVDEGTDEAAGVIVGWEREHNDPAQFRLTVNPTLNCNLRCWYCYEDHEKPRTMNAETLARVKRLVQRLTEREGLRCLNLDFFGGEPLLAARKVVLPVLETAREACQARNERLRVSFTTNGVLLTPDLQDQFLPFSSEEHPMGFQITLDGNQACHDRIRYTEDGRPTFDLIVGHIREALTRGFHVLVRFNYTNENVDSFVDVIRLFREMDESLRARLDFSFHEVWQNRSTRLMRERAQRLRSYFDEAQLTVSSENNYHKGFCYADLPNRIVVNYDGRIYKCTAREFLPELAEGVVTENGEIQYNERYEQRRQLRYGGESCRKCIIYPLCHGGCTQDKLEAPDVNACIRRYTETQKKNIIEGRLRRLLQDEWKK